MKPHYITALVLCAGLLGCNPGRQLERAQETQAENVQSAAEEQAKLEAKHQREQQELNREFAEENQELQKQQVKLDDKIENSAEKTADKLRNEQASLNEERTELRGEQVIEQGDLTEEKQEQQAKLDKEQAEQRAEDSERVQEATARVEERRTEILTDSRKELAKLDQRTADIRSKAANAADAESRLSATNTLSAVPAQRQAIVADMEALEAVKTENLTRAKSDLKERLSNLDETLDRAENNLVR